MTPHEAVWTIFAFRIHRFSHSIHNLPIYDPQIGKRYLMHEKLDGFFKLVRHELELPLTSEQLLKFPGPSSHELRYIDVPQYYTWCEKKKNGSGGKLI